MRFILTNYGMVIGNVYIDVVNRWRRNKDTCSWKRQLEIPVSSFSSWKVRAEVGKIDTKLEKITEVGKWLMKLESFDLT